MTELSGFWNILGGRTLFCSPLALQVSPAEALQVDDDLSLASVGCPLPVAPPCGLEVHGRLCPLQSPPNTVGSPAGLTAEQKRRSEAMREPHLYPSPSARTVPGWWLLPASSARSAGVPAPSETSSAGAGSSARPPGAASPAVPVAPSPLGKPGGRRHRRDQGGPRNPWVQEVCTAALGMSAMKRVS